MELKILHLYPDCMSLYGEYANVAVLKRTLEAMGVAVTVDKCLLDDAPDFSAADFIYMGCGTERTQKAALMALNAHAGSLKAALDRGAVVLFTGNAMEALGRSVTDVQGKEWPGLGLAEFATVETDQRAPEDVIAHSPLWDAPVVGFMNKSSLLTGVEAPLLTALDMGFGNETAHGAEGFRFKNVLGSHLTGPILAKNPRLLEWVIAAIYEKRGESCPPIPKDEWAEQGYAVTARELKERCGK